MPFRLILPFLLTPIAVMALVVPRQTPETLIAGDGSVRLIGQSTGQRGGNDAGGSAGGFGSRFDAAGLPLPPTSTLSVPIPVQVAGVMKRSSKVCQGVPDEYVIDCLIVHFRQALSVTPQSGTYAPVHTVLKETVAKLERVVAKNVDESKPPIRLKTGSGTTSARMRAIKPEAVARANAEAAKIVAEAQTVLLRSADQNPAARLEFVRIAEAVGSNKLLLRS